MPLVLKPGKRASEIDMSLTAELAEQLKCDLLTARILISRGFTDVKECKRFLYPDESELLDPFSMKNMDKVVSAINRIKENGGKITVYGDYDVDGASAVTVLCTALKRYGVNNDFYIPSRRKEGYGLNENALTKIFEGGTNAVITVDCGISSTELIQKFINQGKEIIVTDHHSIVGEIPPCTVLKPGQPGDGYLNPDLCGAGVAFKIACALLGADAYDLADIACVASVADIVPLKGENRYIVKKGLEMLNSAPRECYKTLLKEAGFEGEVTAQTVGFTIAPRINAAGRMAEASIATELMLGEGENLINASKELCRLNALRQSTEKEVMASAEEFIKERSLVSKYKVLTVWGDDWDEGVIGICAARLTEKYKRPSIVFSCKDGVAKGSGRSVAGINLFELLTMAKDTLLGYGGHSAAAGMSAETAKLEELSSKLDFLLRENYDLKNLYPVATYDVKAKLSEITLNFTEGLKLFQPCGCGCSEVALRLDNVHFTNVKKIGADKNHLKLTLRDGSGQSSATSFNYIKHSCDYFENVTSSVIVRPEKNTWLGKVSVDLKIENARFAENINPRNSAEMLTACFYSRLAETGERPQIEFIESSEELAYMISQWESDDISGTLVLCDHPEYSAGFVSLASEEFPRFDISYREPLDNNNGFNSAVFALDTENADLSKFKRIVFYDLLNTQYAGKIKKMAPNAELYALKCGKELFSSIFEEYKRISRDDMMLAYKSLCECEGTAGKKIEVIQEISQRKQVNMPILSVALDTFCELGFMTFDGTLKINRGAPKRDLKESKFYTGLLSCLQSKI